MVCIKCGNNNKKELGWIIVLEPNRILAKHGFTQFYPLCIKCQNDIITNNALNSLRDSPKSVKDYEVRKKLYERNRTLCSKCNVERREGHWTVILIAPTLFIKCIAYLHSVCANEIQIELKIVKPKQQMSIEASLQHYQEGGKS